MAEAEAGPTTTLHPNGLLSFPITHPKIEKPHEVVMGIMLNGPHTMFTLNVSKPPPEIAADPEELPYWQPLYTRLSSVVSGHPVENPNSSGQYEFWMKTYSENETALEQMVRLGVITEVKTAGRVPQGYVEFPKVRVTIPLSQMAKRCGNCERWELSTDEKRMRMCSRCEPHSKTWYCDEECQRKHWKEGYPPHRKMCGK